MPSWKCQYCGTSRYDLKDIQFERIMLAALLNICTLGLARPFMDSLRFPHARCSHCKRLVYVNRQSTFGQVRRY